MIYARMFASEQKAREAVRKLEEEGFSEETIFLVTPDPATDDGVARNIAAAIKAGFMEGYDAKIFARGVARGRSLVLVRTGFGCGMAAIKTLERCGPVDTALLPPPKTWTDGDKFTPLSAAFGLPVLSYDQPAPISAFLGILPLAPGSMFDRSFGFGLLSRKATPLSSLFGIKTLSGKKSPWKSSFGLSLLSQSSGAKPSSFGLPLLSQESAPLSHMFGLPLLTSHH